MIRVTAGAVLLAGLWVTGCASQHASGKKQKIFEPQYKAVSGNVYEFRDVKLTVDMPLRTFGSETYFYALKKSPSPLASPEKYLLFDISLYNPLRRTVSIPYDTVAIVGQDHTKYEPLRSIKPDTNKTRVLIRSLDDFRSSPTLYGLMAFKPIPDWEKEIKLQFQIEVDDEIERHYVIFHLNEPSPQALADWNAAQRQQHERAEFIHERQDESGFVDPSAVEELKQLDPKP